MNRVYVRYSPLALLSMTWLILLTGCSTPNPSLFSAPPIAKYSLSKEANGLFVGIDPYFDKHRTELELGWELPEEILPIFVVVENRSPTTHLLEKTQFTLHSARSNNEGLVPTQSPSLSPSPTEVTSRIIGAAGAVALAPIVFIPALVTTYKSTDERSYATYNFWLNEFPDKTVFPGESVSGFVYLRLAESKAYTAAGDKELHVVMKDTKTSPATTFVFPISRHNADEK